MRIRILIFVILFSFGIGLYLPFISLKEFQGEEGRRVLIAIQMLENSEYLVPKLFGEPYFMKPPLFNWALALFFKLTGNFSEFSARAFSALSLIGASLFLTFIWLNILKKFKKEPSLLEYLLPGLIFLTTPEVIDKALRAEIDGFYTAIITIGIYSWFFFHEIQKRKTLAFILLGFFLGLGVLTKTFQALVFFYFAYIPYLFWQRRLKEIFSFHHLLGISTALLVFLLWAIPVSQKVGLKPFISAWIEEYISSAKAKEMSFLQHLESFTLQALIGFSPWLFTVLIILKSEFRDFLKSQNLGLNKLFFFSVFLFVFGYLFHFLFPGARLRYMLPSVSGLIFCATITFYYLFSLEKMSQKLNIFFKIVLALSIFLSFVSLLYLFFTRLSVLSLFYLFLFLFIFFNLWFLYKKSYTYKELFLFLCFYVFFIKHLYVTFYYPLHEKEMNYFRKAAFQIAELIKDKKELYLCKVIPHHLVYYLKYRYKLIDRIEYLKDCQNLPNKSYILVKADEENYPKEKINKIYSVEIRKKKYYLLITY